MAVGVCTQTAKVVQAGASYVRHRILQMYGVIGLQRQDSFKAHEDHTPVGFLAKFRKLIVIRYTNMVYGGREAQSGCVVPIVNNFEFTERSLVLGDQLSAF